MNRIVLSVFLTCCVSLVAAGSDVPGVRVTPPAPKFTDTERQVELEKRRRTFFEKMSPNSIAVFWSATPRNYAGDVDFYYRQENNHYYLTNLRQNGSTLVLLKNGSGSSEYLFLPKRNPQFETWNGKMYSNEEASRISGVKTVIDSEELPTFLQSLRDRKVFVSTNGVEINNSVEDLYLLLPKGEFDSEGTTEFGKELQFSRSVSGYNVKNARPIVEAMRQIKSPFELKLLQHAIDITTEAQMRAMVMVDKTRWEYEVQAEVEYTFRRRNADYWGYPSIVGCGANATTLHYVDSQSEIKPGELILIDVGAEYEHYTADVTRTFPTNGKFTREQAEIYQIVYDAQEAAARAIKPGADYNDPERAASDVIKEGLFKLGLITDKNSGQYRIWYMHGLGHWLGMNVHDVEGFGTTFRPGMVMTNEPGIYIREDALEYLPKTPEWTSFVEKVRPNFEKYKKIGVRIEDDMLVTETGVEWLTKNLPREINQIQELMMTARRETQRAEIDKMILPGPVKPPHSFLRSNF